MLNRLFVFVGFLVILAIGGAFIVPRFIQWSDYRERLESMGAQAFGAEVAITGDISLSLLPQPLLVLSQVRVGPAGTPAMEVERIEAEFSLFDFLTDRYRVTRLELEKPLVAIAVGTDGSVQSGFALAPGAAQSNVSIANADVVGGRLQLTDARSGEVHAVDALNGQLRLEALSGPFSFSGTGVVDEASYVLRLSSGRVDEAGAAPLTLAVSAADRGFAFDAAGTLETGVAPRFTGNVSYRVPPPRAAEGVEIDAGQGDLLLEGEVEANADRVLLSSYTLLPDQNRAATRLSGAAEIRLGRGMSFNAVVSGGVVALPPRDATRELTDPPYELVRLLGETPLPFVPPIPGRIGLDITELNLRGVSLRELRLDASTDARSWTVSGLTATLTGNTSVGVAGNLSVVDGHPIFAGGVTLASQQLDRFASLWRRAPAGNPLFGQSGSLTADVALSSDTLTLSAGTLTVAGINQGFDAAIGFRQPRSLTLDAAFTTLGPSESAIVAALLPDLAGAGGGSFGATFPTGRLELSASRASLFGLDGRDLAADLRWEGGVLEVSRLQAGDIGGASVNARFTAFGTLMKPELSGNGSVRVSDGAPVVERLLGSIGTPPGVVAFVERSLPAALDFQLDPPEGDGGQVLLATGRLGTSDTTIRARLEEGIASALSSQLGATIEMRSGSPSLMARQLGLGEVPLFDDRTPLQLRASFEGTAANSYEVHARLQGGADHLAFDGNVVPGDFTAISGTGTVEAALADPSALMDLLGAEGVHVPAVAGTARLQFNGIDSLKLSNIAAGGVTGEVAIARREGSNAFTGALKVASVDATGLVPLLAGAAGTVQGEGVWPVGPLDIGAERRSTGRIEVAADVVTLDGAPFLGAAAFALDWDNQRVRLRNFAGTTEDGGTLTLDAELCCSNPLLPAKRLSGRVTLADMPAGRVLPEAVSAVLDGRIDAAAQFDGTGESLAEAMAGMTGSGSYTIRDFSVEAFNPQTFNGLGTLAGVIDLEPEQVAEAVRAQLAAAPFESPVFTGSFSIAGGTLRSPNVAIAGDGARLFGGGSLRLADMTLDARYAMSPTAIADPESLVDVMTAQVTAVVTGPLWAPVARYEVDALVDALKIRASEIELLRLEQLRLEDEARQRAAAAERARVAAEQAAAEEARRLAAEEAARQRAAEEEAARRAAAEEAARRAAETPPNLPLPPLDLGF